MIRIHPIAIFLLVAALPIAGIFANPAGLLPGSELGDVYKHAWSYWHTPEYISGWPDSLALNAPTGGSLWDVMLVPSLLLWPVTAVAGPVVAANLFVWLSLAGIGVATWLLCRAVVGSELGAIVGGVSAQAAPYLLGYPLTSGVHERLAVWLFPLVALAMVRSVRGEGGWRWPATAALGVVVAVPGCGVYGLFMGVMVALFTPILVGRDLSRLRKIAPLLATLLVTLGALLFITGGVSSDSASLSPQPGRLTFATGGSLGSMDSAAFAELLNPVVAASMEAEESGDLLLRISYLGLLALLGSWIGALGVRGERRRLVVGIVALASLFGLLALGPEIRSGTVRLPNLPYNLLSAVVPFYGSTPVPFQQVALFGPLAAVGVAALFSRLERGVKSPVGLAFALCLAFLGERALVSPVGGVVEVAPATVPSIYDHLPEGSGPIVELPRIYRGRDLSHGSLFLSQTSHGRGLPISVHSGVTEWDSYIPVREGVSEDWARTARCLAAGGFEAVVVHKGWFEGEDMANRAVEGLRRALGTPLAEEGGRLLFALSPLGVPLAEDRFVTPFVPEPPTPMMEGLSPSFVPDEIAPIGSGRETSRCPVTVRG